MKILISGSSGLVGSNIYERLKKNHILLTPLIEDLNLMEQKAINNYMIVNKPDFVIHCAGLVGGIQANIKEPVRFLVENMEIGKNLVLAAAAAGIPRLINLGSSCMYPRAAVNPLKEEYVLQGELEPTNEGYAIAKIVVQRLCAYLTRENPNLSYKTIIPCNLYGKWDKFDPAHSHLIPAVIRKLHYATKRKEQKVDIWGSGKARREFMYAGDLADFIVYALSHFENMPDVINVGLGYDYTVDEYYHAIANVVDYKGIFEHDISKPEGMERKLVDITKLTQFGWKARTSLEEGIRMTYQFFLEQEKKL